MFFKRIFFLITILFLFMACSKKPKESLQLPEHSILASDRYWGVVRVPYLRLNDAINNDDQVNGVLRAGTVLSIKEIRSIYQGSLDYWQDYYYVESVEDGKTLSGWISSDSVELFLYKEAAIRNSERFTQDNAHNHTRAIDILE